jgi:nucleoid-associated protein YgaU
MARGRTGFSVTPDPYVDRIDNQEQPMTTVAIGPDLRIQTSRSRRYLVPPRVVGVLLLSAALGLGMTAAQADQPVRTTAYVVESGDTLWNIAATVTEGGEDVRATIATIRRLTGLEGSTIHPGQVLTLPSG